MSINLSITCIYQDMYIYLMEKNLKSDKNHNKKAEKNIE